MLFNRYAANPLETSLPVYDFNCSEYEFWPKPFKEVKDHDVPQSTPCANAESAIALEAKFHDVGWPARALTLTNRIERINLTSNR